MDVVEPVEMRENNNPHSDNDHDSLNVNKKEEIGMEDEETFVAYAEGRMFRLHQHDLDPAEEDPEEYFQEIYNDFKDRHRRMKEIIHEEDYEDVHYWQIGRAHV